MQRVAGRLGIVPTGETAVRFKKEGRLSGALLVSFSF
jgi:hypothetical protein